MATFAGNPAATSIDGTEIVPISQGGTDKRTTAGDIAALATAATASYDNATSGLAADTVQEAIDEIVASPPSPDAEDVAYDNSTSALAATDVQAAIDEVAADVASLSGVIDVEAPSNSSGTVTLDFASKSRYAGAITLGANVTTLAFSNLPGSGKFAEYELHIKQDGTGSRTFAIPASHKALGGSDTAIASAANAVTVLTASTVDNGTTWRYAMQESA